jgi:hypothetical protein
LSHYFGKKHRKPSHYFKKAESLFVGKSPKQWDKNTIFRHHIFCYCTKTFLFWTKVGGGNSFLPPPSFCESVAKDNKESTTLCVMVLLLYHRRVSARVLRRITTRKMSTTLCKMSTTLCVMMLLLVWSSKVVHGQTPLCAVFPSCVGGTQCCLCAGGPTACTGTMNDFNICDSDCANGASVNSAATLHWSFYPISLSGVNTSNTYTMTINAYIYGQDSPISSFFVSARASSSWLATLSAYYAALESFISGTPPVPPTPATITWSAAGTDFQPMAYSHFTVYIADSTENTYMSYINTFNLTSSPTIATGIQSNMQAGVQIDTNPAITFPAPGMDSNGMAMFAYTAAPTDCANAGVTDASTCTSFCVFLSSYSLGTTGTLTTNSDGTFSCDCSTFAIYGNTSPVYSCQGTGGTATTSASTTSFSTSSSSSSSIVPGGGNTVTQSASAGGGSNGGAIAGGIIGGLVCVVCCVVGYILYNRRKSRTIHSTASFQGGSNA